MDGAEQQQQPPRSLPLQARRASRATVHRPAFLQQPPQPLAVPAAPLNEAEKEEDDDYGPSESLSLSAGGLGQQLPQSTSPARPVMMLPIIQESMGGSMADQSSSSSLASGGGGGSISEL